MWSCFWDFALLPIQTAAWQRLAAQWSSSCRRFLSWGACCCSTLCRRLVVASKWWLSKKSHLLTQPPWSVLVRSDARKIFNKNHKFYSQNFWGHFGELVLTAKDQFSRSILESIFETRARSLLLAMLACVATRLQVLRRRSSFATPVWLWLWHAWVLTQWGVFTIPRTYGASHSVFFWFVGKKKHQEKMVSKIWAKAASKSAAFGRQRQSQAL